MNKKGWISFVAAILVLIGAFFYFKDETATIDGDRVIASDYEIPAGKEVVLNNGAELTVTGSLTIDGVLSCSNGPLRLNVAQTLVIRGELRCEGVHDSPTIMVVTRSIVAERQAVISSSGSVSIVSDSANLLRSAVDIERKFLEVGTATEENFRIGPFSKDDTPRSVSTRAHPRAAELTEDPLLFVPRAHAHGDEDVFASQLGGTWHIGQATSSDSRALFHFDLGEHSELSLDEFHLISAGGRDGANNRAVSCTAQGENGASAPRLSIHAGDVYVNNATLALGDGGDGGDAEADRGCSLAVASGGSGGEAGNLKITADRVLEIGQLHILPGMSGDGGDATALGAPGMLACPGTEGGSAKAIGGNAAHNYRKLHISGAVANTQSIRVDRALAGIGGSAFARGGEGGGGNGCDCDGGRGGDALAQGGMGGDALLELPFETAEAHAGMGGSVDAIGGAGGVGGSCPLKPRGGDGGDGGDSMIAAGRGGKGTTADGAPGEIKNAAGGEGGKGGDGCNEGEGGSGGTGAPLGKNGQHGGSNCPNTAETTTTPTDSTLTMAIPYRNVYLPINQLTIRNEAGCGGPHWHAQNNTVTATDGTLVTDPGAPCGYGKVAEYTPRLVPKTTTKATEQFQFE